MDCCKADQGVHVYWLVTDLIFDDWCLKVKVKAEEVDMDKACDEVSSLRRFGFVGLWLC